MSRPDLDDRRADEDVVAPVDEVDHHLLQLALGHLAVADRDRASLGGDLPRPARASSPMSSIAVVDEEDLAAARQLALDRLAQQRRGRSGRRSADRQPIGGRRRDDRDLAQPAHRHLQRARDRRRGQRQHVDLRAQLLEALLVGDAEALLLVDDHQAEVLEADVARQQRGACPTTTSSLPSASAATVFCCSALLRKRDSTATRTGKSANRSEKVDEVLLGQHRGRRQHRHLLAAQHRQQAGAQRDLGLAVADVAADQAVHRHAVLHVGEHRLDRLGLVGRLLERERLLEVAEHGVGRREGVARQRGPLRVELQQLLGDLARLGGDAPRASPARSRRPACRAGSRSPRRRRSGGRRRCGRPARRPCRRRTRGAGSPAGTPRTVSFLSPR